MNETPRGKPRDIITHVIYYTNAASRGEFTLREIKFVVAMLRYMISRLHYVDRDHPNSLVCVSVDHTIFRVLKTVAN